MNATRITFFLEKLIKQCKLARCFGIYVVEDSTFLFVTDTCYILFLLLLLLLSIEMEREKK